MSTINRTTLIGLLVILVASGCTTLKPAEMSLEQLHEQIFAGNIIEVGDSVKIVTADGAIHKFKVSAITANRITGKDIELPIADIVAVETREFSRGKTTALAAVGVVLAYVIAEAAATASLLDY
ncbi:MAG: hypothetical protein OEU40_15780 [Gammaproteobacteria bacterium]|nr:hypothetical protein [Gammaproteobacteria bacterium]